MMHEKFSQTHSAELAKAMNKVAVARHRNRLVSSTTNQLIKQLYNVTGSTLIKISHVNVDSLVGEVIFDGLMKITASIQDKGYAKVIDIPIQITKSSAVFPTNAILKHKIESIVIKNTRGFNATQHIASELKRIDRNEKYLALQSKGSKLPKIAVSIQEGEAWVRRTIEGFEYEYDPKVVEILKNEALSQDDKVAAIKDRIAYIVQNSSDDDEGTQIKSVNWDAIKFDDSDIVSLVENATELEAYRKEDAKEQPKQASVEVKAKELDPLPGTKGIENLTENKINKTLKMRNDKIYAGAEEGDVIPLGSLKYKLSRGIDAFGKPDTLNWLLTLVD